jgi:hypothetical protein
LIKSVGKNYIHKKYIVLNTCLFKLEEDKSFFNEFNLIQTFKYIPFVNFGLILGSNGKTTIDTKDKEKLKNLICPMERDKYRCPDLSTMCNDLIDGFDYETSVTLVDRFIKCWSPVLKRVLPPGFSWFLPKHLGGLGLPLLGSHQCEDRISYLQLRLANFLNTDIEKQNLLTSMSNILVSESASLYKEARKFLPKGLITKVVKSKVVDPLEGIALARAFREQEFKGAGKVEKRYDIWRSDFERLFKRVSRSTYAAIGLYDLYISTPSYLQTLNCIYTNNFTVDLRLIDTVPLVNLDPLVMDH